MCSRFIFLWGWVAETAQYRSETDLYTFPASCYSSATGHTLQTHSRHTVNTLPMHSQHTHKNIVNTLPTPSQHTPYTVPTHSWHTPTHFQWCTPNILITNWHIPNTLSTHSHTLLIYSQHTPDRDGGRTSVRDQQQPAVWKTQAGTPWQREHQIQEEQKWYRTFRCLNVNSFKRQKAKVLHDLKIQTD